MKHCFIYSIWQLRGAPWCQLHSDVNYIHSTAPSVCKVHHVTRWSHLSSGLWFSVRSEDRENPWEAGTSVVELRMKHY